MPQDARGVPEDGGAAAAPVSRPGFAPPILVGLVVFASSLLVARLDYVSESRSLEEAAAAARTRVVSEVQLRLEQQIQSLERIARRWELRGGMQRDDWAFDSRLLLDHFPHMQAIEWVDASFRVRWVQPLEGNEAEVGLDLHSEDRRLEALESARDRNIVTVTRPIELVQGGRGFLVFVPLYPNGRFEGFILGVYRIEPLLDDAVRNIAAGFGIRVRDRGETLWSRDAGPAAPSFGPAAKLRFSDALWDVEVAPGPAVIAAHMTWLPWILVVGGTVNAVFFAFSIQLARSGRWRTSQLRTSNDHLLREMERRSRAEQAEQEAVDELEAVVSSFPDHVWSGTVQPDGTLAPRYFSDTIGRIAARAASDFRNDPRLWVEMVHDADRQAVTEAYRALFANGQGLSLEYRIRRADGEIRWVRDRVQVGCKDGRKRLDGIIADVTAAKREEEERLRLESHFQEAQKLESLGVLAGGIAHDFNNLLVGMLGHAHLALGDLPAESPARDSVDRIERAARRAAELCRQLLAYAGKGSFVVEQLDLREVIEEMGELLSTSRSKRVTLDCDFAQAVPPIEADASQIRQLVLNLLTNASEAIGERSGVVALSTRRVELAPEALRALALDDDLVPGTYVELRVRDEGSGMDEDTKRRMFEPFYSTKSAGRGLGLAAVLGIVRAQGGGIRVTSAPGRGTEVTVYFPALVGHVAPSRASQRDSDVPRCTGTLLLVDDEEDAREVGLLMLERAGFRVITATDGAAALRIFRQRRHEIDCVLLDLTMPEMDGEQTHRGLRDLDPDVRVILCSGYPEQEAAERFRDLNVAGFLGKPYTPEALSAVVEQALRREDPVTA